MGISQSIKMIVLTHTSVKSPKERMINSKSVKGAGKTHAWSFKGDPCSSH